MLLSDLLERRPLLVALAGPNGAGKSTFYEAFLARAGLCFVNADLLALSLQIDPYAAAELADRLRRQLVAQRESFLFETVFSDPVGEKVEFLRSAEAAGYTVLLIFIGLATAELSDQRVAMRAASGGHDVPPEKIIARFPRTLRNLKRAFAGLSNVLVYDHSNLERGYALVAAKVDGSEVAWADTVPAWLKDMEN